jgi:hypothetical protein
VQIKYEYLTELKGKEIDNCPDILVDVSKHPNN